MQANRSFHMREETGGKVTDRRLMILAGLVRMCWAGEDNDDSLRTLLVLTVGADWPDHRSNTAGRALGQLNATEAATFAAHADAMNGGAANPSDAHTAA